MTVGELKTFLKDWEDEETPLCFGVPEEGIFTFYEVEVIGVELGDLTLAGNGYKDNPRFTVLYPIP